jgi:predicted RND superfamily exporter protein
MSRLELAFQTLESKAGVLTGFLAAILAAALGFMAAGQPQSMPIVTLVAFSAGVCLLLICLLFLVLCLTTRPWVDAPGWQQFDNTEEYGRDPARYRCQQVSNMHQSWEANSTVLHTKGMLFKHALWLMLAGIVCLTVAGCMLAFQH